jgi:hypothetical protein
MRMPGDGDMASGSSSFANIKHHLRGMTFPASREAILERARSSGAGQDTLEELESLPQDVEFESLADVIEAAGADQAPQTGILERKP